MLSLSRAVASAVTKKMVPSHHRIVLGSFSAITPFIGEERGVIRRDKVLPLPRRQVKASSSGSATWTQTKTASCLPQRKQARLLCSLLGSHIVVQARTK